MANIDKNILLEEIAKQLDISPSMYKLAVDRYNSVAEFLKGKGIIANFYPQGSFRLGTVTRPYKNGTDAEYDIDLVCQMDEDKVKTTPKYIKDVVGNELKKDATYESILDEEGKRCWTLLYSEKDGVGFHLDILPSVQESKQVIEELITKYNVDRRYASTAIAITEKKDNIYGWSSSNPNGYAEWFNTINGPFYSMVEKAARTQLFEKNRNLYNSIEDVPPQLIRTPLQRVIQLLKRHRDIRFAGTEFEEDKPISMIINTLTALIVKNGNVMAVDTYSLLKHVVSKMSEYAELINNRNAQIAQSKNPIIKRDINDIWYIPNPVNPAENFADRWHENNNKKARAFFNWIAWLEKDLIANVEKADFDISEMKNNFGKDIVERALSKHDLSSSEGQIKPPAINIIAPGKPWGN